MNDGACVVLVPSDAVGEEHCTVIYLGEIPNTTLSFEAAFRMTRTLATCYQPFSTLVSHHSLFGVQHERVSVAELEMTRQMEELRQSFQRFNGSEYTEFKPHITMVNELRPVGSVVPFNRLACWYGDEKSVWLLGTNHFVAG